MKKAGNTQPPDHTARLQGYIDLIHSQEGGVVELFPRTYYCDPLKVPDGIELRGSHVGTIIKMRKGEEQ